MCEDIKHTGHVVICRRRIHPDLGQRSVGIPFHEGDLIVGQQRIELGQDVCAHLGTREVQHVLIAGGFAGAVGGMVNPVRVGGEQLRRRVDHLRLHPDSEVHPERPHVVDQRSEPVGKFFGVDIPVPEPVELGVALSEPAVVHNEKFGADARSEIGQLHLVRLVHIESGGFPRVVQHLARLGMHHQGTAVVMQDRTELIETLRRARSDRVRSPPRLPGIQREFPVVRVDADAECSGAVGRLLGYAGEISGVHQCGDIHLATGFGGVAGEHDVGVVVMGGDAAPRLQHGLRVPHGLRENLLFGTPIAVDVREIPACAGDVERCGHGPGEHDRCL